MHMHRVARRRNEGGLMTMSRNEPVVGQTSLLVVDDDVTFCRVTKRAMEACGFAVRVAHDVPSAIQIAEEDPPEFALVDLKMPGESGLELVRRLKVLREDACIVVLTGYASIATAIEAIKLGATHYLAKPARTDEILAAFGNCDTTTGVSIREDPMRIRRVEWEHIQKVLMDNRGNISATARALGMHRRTLQRKLAKRPIGE